MTNTAIKPDVRLEPFPHATATSVLPASLADTALAWMETDASWSLRIASFYEQWEMHLDETAVPPHLGPLLHTSTVDRLVRMLFVPFTDEKLNLVDVTAHKLLPGQTIRIHNDHLEGEESHRLLIQLNRGWIDTQGGLLMLFGSSHVNDVRRVIRPLHASALAFAISPKSFHAVSTVRSGERYTLIYSFKAESQPR
jgi:Rps23 Pro-64 3,4-dihydroxylase Tpa1-like proline 4-hydroxylase